MTSIHIIASMPPRNVSRMMVTPSTPMTQKISTAMNWDRAMLTRKNTEPIFVKWVSTKAILL